MSVTGESDFSARAANNVNEAPGAGAAGGAFYLRKNNQQFGPYDQAEVIRLVNEEQFTLNNLACAHGMNEWQPLGTVLKAANLPEEVRRSIQLDGWRPLAAPSHNYKYDDLNGVGGWLLLFIVGLTILGPLFTLANIYQTIEAVGLVGDRFPAFKTVAFLEIALLGGMMLFSIYAGISLWAVRKGAVATAKIYLVCLVAASVLDFILVLASGLPEIAMKEVRGEAVLAIARAVVYAGVWFAYLSNSKRVQATYAAEAEAG